MSIDHGRSPSEPGYSAEPEPEEVSAVPVSIPNAARKLWQSGCDSYPDIVFVTGAGDIGMKADFGRAEVRRIGEWCYLARAVEHLSAGYAAFPRDVAAVLSKMSDGEGVLSAAMIADELPGITERRVKEIHRALKVLGLAQWGVLCDSDADAYVARGSGYWATLTGAQLSSALHASAIEARRAATENTGAVHESAVGEAETPSPLSSTNPNTERQSL